MEKCWKKKTNLLRKISFVIKCIYFNIWLLAWKTKMKIKNEKILVESTNESLHKPWIEPILTQLTMSPK